MPDWTHDQLILALEFYYQCPENMHTDSHAKCKEMADLFSHALCIKYVLYSVEKRF